MRAGLIAAFVPAAFLLASGRPAAGSAARIEAVDPARVSVEGTFPSLRAVVEELSWQAGFSLEAFDADDRPVRARIRERPLPQVLGRLLAGESYTLRLDPSGGVRAVRVLGTNERGRERRRAPVYVRAGSGEFVVPVRLFVDAFSPARTSEERRQALELIRRRVAGDPRQRRAFLETSDERIARALLPYEKTARPALAMLAEAEPDALVREKLQAVLRRLAALSLPAATAAPEAKRGRPGTGLGPGGGEHP